MSEHIDKVKEVAERLLAKEKISGAEFNAIMEGREFIEVQEISSSEQAAEDTENSVLQDGVTEKESDAENKEV